MTQISNVGTLITKQWIVVDNATTRVWQRCECKNFGFSVASRCADVFHDQVVYQENLYHKINFDASPIAATYKGHKAILLYVQLDLNMKFVFCK